MDDLIGCLMPALLLLFFTPPGWILLFVIGIVLDALVFDGQIRDYLRTLEVR